MASLGGVVARLRRLELTDRLDGLDALSTTCPDAGRRRRRILNGAAQRLLAARRDRDPIAALPGATTAPAMVDAGQRAALGEVASIPAVTVTAALTLRLIDDAILCDVAGPRATRPGAPGSFLIGDGCKRSDRSVDFGLAGPRVLFSIQNTQFESEALPATSARST